MKIRRAAVIAVALVQIVVVSPLASGTQQRRAAAPIKDANVKDFAGRFNRTLSEVIDELLPKLARLRPSSDPREEIVSLSLNVAGGTVRAEGLGLLLPEPRRYDLSLELSGVREPDAKGPALKIDGILQFDFITHGRNQADGLFRGVLRLGGKFGGSPEVYGEVRNGKIVGLVAGSSRSGKKPSDFVSYTGTLAGGGYYSDGYKEGQGKQAQFNAPTGVAVDDEDGTVYVADSENGAIRKVTPQGQVTTLSTEVDEPRDLAFDNNGDLIVGDHDSDAAPLGRVSTETGALTPIVHNHTEDGQDLCRQILSTCEGRSPLGTMTWVEGIDVQGGVTYVAQAQYPPSLRMVLPDGTVTTVHEVDEGGRDGGDCGHAGILGGTADVAKGNDGELYFTIDVTGCYGVLVLEPDGSVGTLAGNLDEYGDRDGRGESAQFFSPTSLVFDGTRYLYVADTQNNMIRRVDVTTGDVVRVAGCPEQEQNLVCGSELRDGNRQRAQFYLPMGLALDEWGDLYVADRRNNAVRVVRMVTDPEREPSISAFAPFAVTRGQATTIKVTGDNLGLAEGADLGSGVAVVDMQHAGDRSLVLDVAVDAAAEPGPRTLTIQTPYGSVSSPPGLSFVVLEEGVASAEVSTIAGTGSWVPGIHEGPAQAAQFGFPVGMDAQDSDRLLVVDTLEQRIRLVATKDGASAELLELLLYASGATNALNGILAGLGPAGLFLSKLGVVKAIVGATESSLRPIVAEAVAELCKQADVPCSRLAMPWAGLPLDAGESNGIRLNARFFLPTDVTSAGGGKFFVADAGNSKVRTIGVNPSGDKPEDAPYMTFSTDRLNERPLAVAPGPGSSALAALPASHQIVKIELKNGGVVTDFAGVKDQIGCTATENGHKLGVPLGMDTHGDATYVADPFCQTIWRIEDGTVYDMRGSVRLPGPALDPCSDGPAAFARFGAPMDVAVDSGGNIWFVDALCGSVRVIRNLFNEPGGDVLGQAEKISGYLNSAKQHIPESLGVEFAQLLERLDESFLATNAWWVTTVAGSMNGEQGFVDGPAERARFFLPIGIAVADRGDRTEVFVSDAGNLRVRLLSVPDSSL